MPISPILLQRRHAELGRIRLGQKGDRGQPQKLGSFRFTSPSESYIKDLAELYGGHARAWDNSGKAEFEVFTTASSIPVIAVKGGLSQWMETWSGGGCTHRCDGERQADGTLCDLEDRAHVAAKPTTRLSVMLPELDAIGVWRMESHGWNAAAEIPAVAELAQYVGDLVPAVLHLVERRSIKDGKTSRFVVPVLDLRIGQARLREIAASVASGEAQLSAPAGGEAKAIEAPKADTVAGEGTEAPVQIPTPQQIADADLDTVRKMADYLERNLGEHPATMAARDRLATLQKAAPQPDADGAVDAEWTEDPPAAAVSGEDPADRVWQEILQLADERRGWGLDQVVEDFKKSMGLIPDVASESELANYLEQMRTGEPVKA